MGWRGTFLAQAGGVPHAGRRCRERGRLPPYNAAHNWGICDAVLSARFSRCYRLPRGPGAVASVRAGGGAAARAAAACPGAALSQSHAAAAAGAAQPASATAVPWSGTARAACVVGL